MKELSGIFVPIEIINHKLKKLEVCPKELTVEEVEKLSESIRTIVTLFPPCHWWLESDEWRTDELIKRVLEKAREGTIGKEGLRRDYKDDLSMQGWEGHEEWMDKGDIGYLLEDIYHLSKEIMADNY